MTPAMWLTIGLFGLTVVFQLGGVFWLARNHFYHVNQRLDRLETDVMEIKETVAFIKGHLSKEEF
jgi:hypothetical protein